MTARITPLTDTVDRCVPRHDGGYMIVAKKGNAGSSPVPIPVGAHVVIREGQAVRAAR